MRLLNVSVLCFAIALGNAPTITAQSKADSVKTAQEGARTVDGWLTVPTPVMLTAAQRKAIDSIKKDYSNGLLKMKTTHFSGTKQERRTAELAASAKFVNKTHEGIRAVLTAEQVVAFNANLKAARGR